MLGVVEGNESFWGATQECDPVSQLHQGGCIIETYVIQQLPSLMEASC